MARIMNIQDEVQKIHSKFGTSEMANYKIQLLFEKYHKEIIETQKGMNKMIESVNTKNL